MVAPPFVCITFTDNPESYKSAKSGQMEHQLKCFSVTKSKSFVTKKKTFLTPADFSCIYINVCIVYRDVFTGVTGATAVAPKFSDTLTLSPPGGRGQILPTIAEVASKFSLRLRP